MELTCCVIGERDISRRLVTVESKTPERQIRKNRKTCGSTAVPSSQRSVGAVPVKARRFKRPKGLEKLG